MTTSRKLTLGFFALIALAIGLERLIVTDREAIEKSLDVLAQAAERGDTATLHAYVSPKYSFLKQDAAAFKEVIHATLSGIRLEKVSFMKTEIVVNRPYATLNLKVMIHVATKTGAQGLGFDGAAMIRLRVAMEKTDQGWLVVECENLGPG